MTGISYAAPEIELSTPTTDNEAAPAIIAAAAAVAGVGVAFATFVCAQCPGQCRSLDQTVTTIQNWVNGTGC